MCLRVPNNAAISVSVFIYLIFIYYISIQANVQSASTHISTSIRDWHSCAILEALPPAVHSATNARQVQRMLRSVVEQILHVRLSKVSCWRLSRIAMNRNDVRTIVTVPMVMCVSKHPIRYVSAFWCWYIGFDLGLSLGSDWGSLSNLLASITGIHLLYDSARLSDWHAPSSRIIRSTACLFTWRHRHMSISTSMPTRRQLKSTSSMLRRRTTLPYSVCRRANESNYQMYSGSYHRQMSNIDQLSRGNDRRWWEYIRYSILLLSSFAHRHMCRWTTSSLTIEFVIISM